MYTCYHREVDNNIYAMHMKVLYKDFNKACDALEDFIKMLCEDFTPPNREEIKATLDKKHRAVYFVSDERRDIFTIEDLPVVE